MFINRRHPSLPFGAYDSARAVDGHMLIEMIGPCTLLRTASDYVLRSPTGETRLDVENTSEARLRAHWHGCLHNVGLRALVVGQIIGRVINQNTREITILACLDDDQVALGEYTMPGGTTALIELHLWSSEPTGRHITYGNPGSKWAMVLADDRVSLPWSGHGQTRGQTVCRGKRPLAAEMRAQRLAATRTGAITAECDKGWWVGIPWPRPERACRRAR